MKLLNYILIIVLTTVLFACSSNAENKENIEIAETNISELDKSTNETEHYQVFDCLRGQAEPIVVKAIYPNSTFTLQSDKLTAIEIIYLDNGDKVNIKNWGCEYYVLSFHIETSKYNADTTAMKYWYVNSFKLMDELKQGIDAPIDIEKGLQAFNNHISRNVFDLELGTEIDYGENEIRSFVSLDNISKIRNDIFAVTISFAIGPL